MFDSVSAESIRSGTLFNHQRVTDVWTNCRERHGQVRMFPLLVSSLLSAADFPHSARKCPLQYSSRQIRRLPHLNLALCSPRPNPLLHGLRPQPVLSAARGLLGRTQSSGSRSPSLQALGLGRGKSKPPWRLPSSLRSPQISLTAGLCRAKPPPAPSYPLFTH